MLGNLFRQYMLFYYYDLATVQLGPTHMEALI